MTEEKIINAGKKENQPQDKFADELLSDDELDKVAGGIIDNMSESVINKYTTGK